jgi:autophagy-related protein 11
LEITQADLTGVREELQRALHEQVETKQGEKALRTELASARESESKLERSQRLVAEILQVAISYRQALGKAVVTAQNSSSYPPSKGSAGLADSVFSNGTRPHNTLSTLSVEETPSIDPAEPEVALDLLREFDLDICAESLAKPVAVLRKWQRQCKDYRERAKGKITFRNFTKGDLALFLPIKNSQQKPWAAFNGLLIIFCLSNADDIDGTVAFPHYFLLATGHIADQLKTREWIVARITSITEKVASNQVSLLIFHF